MFIEQIRYIRAYLKIANLNPWLFSLNFITAVVYKILDATRPFVAAMIIKGLTEQNAEATYFSIFAYAIIYFSFRGVLFLNWRAYSWNLIYCYNHLQDKIFKKLLSVDHNFTNKVNRGRLMNVINSDLFSIGEMNDEISEFFTTIFQIGIVIVVSFQYDITVTIIMIVSAIIYTRICTVHDRRYNFFWWKSQEGNDAYSNFLNQVLTGLQEVKAFNMLSKLHQHLGKIQKRYDKNYTAQRKHLAIRDNDVKYVEYFFRALIIFVCILAMVNGHMEIDILVLLYSYHEQLIEATRNFVDSMINIRLDNASVRRVESVLNYKAEKQADFGSLNLDHVSGELRFEKVSLSINHHEILKNINLKIRPREVVAIVGYPGSGKTKLFDLILRLFQPSKGRIYLDGININDFSKEIFASNIAVANQIPFIFNISIRQNLNFVDSDIKRQIEACKTVGIHDFIESLPMGYNTILRENGGNISGGQRQMISIARTLLTDAEVFLLDDITTSLDPDTAQLVPQLIDKVRKKHTVIMITKKPELMKTADRIIVLDRGRVSDIGTHEKLLKRSAIYKSLQALRSPSIGCAI